MSEKNDIDIERYSIAFWEDADDDTRKAIVQEHVDRASQGREVWNAWAEALDETIDSVSADKENFQIKFIDAEFTDSANFQKFLFPINVNFIRTRFGGIAGFDKARFSGDAWFIEARFSGDAGFNDAEFSGNVEFEKASFGGDAWFIGAKFSGDALFSKSQFNGFAWFSAAQFNGVAGFSKSRFNRDAGFIEARFRGISVFNEARFSGNTWFSKARFSGSAGFGGTMFDKLVAFEEASFVKVPNVFYTKFSIPPALSRAHIEYQTRKDVWGGLGYPEGNDDVRSYRALKQLAIKGADFSQELYFFGLEQRAKRGVETKGIGIVPGLLYEWTSDFGRSVIRPLVGLTLLVTAGYFIQGYQIDQVSSEYRNQCGYEYTAAKRMYILQNTLPLLSLDQEKAKAMKRCLFKDGFPPDSLELSNNAFKLFAGVFIFLFGLGVRNRLRAK